MTPREKIAALGAGRMGRGIAIAFAFAGHDVALIDFKPREAEAFGKLAADALGDIETTLRMLARVGLLEFIDWGGGDILHYASKYLTGALNSERYAAPEIVKRNMAEGKTGLSARQGFLDYAGMDVDAYREARLKAFVDLLRHFELARKPVRE